MGKPELAMMSRSLACVLLSLCLVDVSQGAEVYATGNPHMPPTPHQELSDNKDFHKQCSAEPCIPAINSLDVLREPMPTQTDTHLRTILVKSQLGDVIPVYLFRQPARLSELQLSFQLVLTNSVSQRYVEIPVSMAESQDSWFPGYRWSILVCEGCGGVTHLGWKFTGAQRSFYALIVGVTEEKAGERGQVGLRELVAEQLRVGMKAPAWMLALLAATRVK